MSGYPFSGKSFVVGQLIEILPYQVELIDPKSYRSEDYETLDEIKKREENLSVWQVSVELLVEAIRTMGDEEIIIYDTACSDRKSMYPIFLDAKRQGHHILFIFVIANLETCKQRAGDNWLSDEVIDKYTKRFEENTPLFAKTANKLFSVRNDGGASPDLTRIAEHIISYYG